MRGQAVTDRQGKPGQAPRSGPGRLHGCAVCLLAWLGACTLASVTAAQSPPPEASAPLNALPPDLPSSLHFIAHPFSPLPYPTGEIPLRNPVRTGVLIPKTAHASRYTDYLERRVTRAQTMRLGGGEGGLAHPDRIRKAPDVMEPWGYLESRRVAAPRLRGILEADFPELMSLYEFQRFLDTTMLMPAKAQPASEPDLVPAAVEPEQPAPEPPAPMAEHTEDWMVGLWRKKIQSGYTHLRAGDYGAAWHHFESAERIRRRSYEAALGLLHAALGLQHMNQAGLQLHRLTIVAPRHFASSFRPEELYDPPQLYAAQERNLRDKINQGSADAPYWASYAYVTWFSGNRPLALKAAKQPGVRQVVPHMWRIMEATMQGQLVGQPRMTMVIEGLPTAQQPDADAQPTDRRTP